MVLSSAIEYLTSTVRLLTHRRRRSYLVKFEETIEECLADVELSVREMIGSAFNQLMEQKPTVSSGSDKGGYSVRDLLALRAKIQSGVSGVFKSKLEKDSGMISTNLLPGMS